MNWYIKSTLKIAQVQKISPQQAIDRGMFGPVYHGTTPDRRALIDQEGFKSFEGEAGEAQLSHGYENHPYGYMTGGPPPPVHHLGFGIYFTTAKAIAKEFSGGTTKGMKTYYLDVPNMEEINFGSTNTMMKWWKDNGYDPELAKRDRVAATRELTRSLSSQFDAVWYKGKGLYRLLDGDQICVYDPSRIYEVDKAIIQPGEIGSRVKRIKDGMIGTIVDSDDAVEIKEKFPLANTWIRPETTKILTVKWRRGGTQTNVQDTDVNFL